MSYLADTELSENVRWFIQFSQVHQKFQCLQCSAIARGVVYYTRNKDKKIVRRTRNDYETIAHTDLEGAGNRLTHKRNCFVLAEIIKVLGKQEPAPEDIDVTEKVIVRKCGCSFRGMAIEKPCGTHEHLWDVNDEST